MLRAGLVGLPSSGKTTLFQLLTSAREAARTHGKAEANVGMSRVPDARLDQLTAMFQPKKRTAATVEFADMAAARGEAVSLLDVVAYRNADALLHVVRAFGDPMVPHPKETIDPVRDARMIEDELILADLGAVERRLERLEKDLKKNPSADLKREQELLLQGRAQLDAGRALRTLGLSIDDTRRLRGFQFLSAKPLLVVINLDENDVAAADRAAEKTGLADFLKETHAHAVGVCAKIELEIAQLDAADAAAFLADLGLKESGLDRVIRAAYDLLGYIRSSRSARTNAAPGRSRGRHRRLKPQARFIPTSSAASSAPKSCRATRCSAAARSSPAAITASCGSRAKSTSSLTAT